MDLISKAYNGINDRKKQVTRHSMGKAPDFVYKLEPLRISPNGAASFLVRSSWTKDGVWIYSLLALAVEEKDGFRIHKISDAWAHDWVGDMIGADVEDCLGHLIGIFDYDQDGFGELLLERSGYEGHGFELFQFDGKEIREVGSGFGWGC